MKELALVKFPFLSQKVMEAIFEFETNSFPNTNISQCRYSVSHFRLTTLDSFLVLNGYELLPSLSYMYAVYHLILFVKI